MAAPVIAAGIMAAAGLAQGLLSGDAQKKQQQRQMTAQAEQQLGESLIQTEQSRLGNENDAYNNMLAAFQRALIR